MTSERGEKNLGNPELELEKWDSDEFYIIQNENSDI